MELVPNRAHCGILCKAGFTNTVFVERDNFVATIPLAVMAFFHRISHGLCVLMRVPVSKEQYVIDTLSCHTDL
jgi:hypothetical protein